jgi:nitroreductase
MKNRLSGLFPIFCLILSAGMLCCVQVMTAAAADGTRYDDAAAFISDIPTTQSFSDTPVNDEDLQTILLAGINAPSAMNSQPWHFSAVTDKAVLEQIAGDMSFGRGGPKPPAGGNPPEGFEPPAFPGGVPSGEGMPGPMPPMGGGAPKAGVADAPLAIIVSCPENSKFDAGLACQNMSAAAQLLGYGTKIISSPTIALNGEKQNEYREILGIPENYSAAAVLLIGYENAESGAADAVTSATVRSPMEEVVTFVAP